MTCPILSALLVMQSISSVFLAVDEEKEKYYKLGNVESSTIYFKSPKLSFVGFKIQMQSTFWFWRSHLLLISYTEISSEWPSTTHSFTKRGLV